MDERQRTLVELEEERGSLTHQLQLALARADSEALARSIAEETVADLEKDKSMKELELKDLMTKQRSELSGRDSALNSVSYNLVFYCFCSSSLFYISHSDEICSVD